MSNTLSSLAARIAADNAIYAATGAWTPIKNFCTNFREMEAHKGTAIRVPIWASSGGAGEFDKESNNYAGSYQDVSGTDITLTKHFVRSVTFDDTDFTTCDVPFWEGSGKIIGEELSRAVVSYVVGMINTTNVPKTTANELVFSATKANFAQLRKQCAVAGMKPEDVTVLLDPQYFATMLAALDSSVYGGTDAIRNGEIPRLFGFGSVAECYDFTTTEGEYLVGAIVAKDAIAIAGRYLQPQSAENYVEVGKASDEKSGLTIGFRRFGNTATGDNYLAGEMLVGAKLLQPTKIVRLVSQATADPTSND